MHTHIKIVAILHIVFGVIGILGGLFILALFGGIAGLVGMNEASADAAIAIPILSGIGGLIAFVAIVLSVPGIIAGAGLLAYKPWARILAIIISAIEILNFPFGTALGFYGIWALLSPEGTALFTGAPAPDRTVPYNPAPRP